MYQARWLMLFPKHAVDREYSFRLFTEKKSAKDFDDIVLRYEQDGKIVHRFIQVKHRQGRHKKISIGDLLTPGKNGAFGLIKYLIAYLKIKSSGEFEGEIEDFVIITNDDFDSADSTSHPVRKLRMMPSGKNKGKEISVIRIDTQDEFLDVGDGVRYKFDDSIISYLQENKNFIKREVGREVSDKEIEDFLNKLVFAVNLPSGTELSEIIKSELGKEFSNTDAKHFYSRYQEEVLILLEKEEEEFLSYEKAKALLEEIREEILGAVWFGIIEPVASFTGRGRVLTALHNMLQRSAKKQAVISQVASISGLGGVGKSELARKYTYKYGKDYYVNAIWIDAESTETMKNSFLDLANNRLGIPTKDRHERDKTIENIVREVYAFFARRGRRSLFIFDNAEGYEDIKRFLPSSLHPRHKKPYILITSRNKDWRIAEDEEKIKTIQLGVFKKTEAIRFVKRALNIKDNLQDEEIKKLTEELQYFPLALGQAIAYINESNIVLSRRGEERVGVSDYLKRYEKEAEKLLDFESKYKSDRYTKTTFIAWKITIDAIAKRECGPEALKILEVMAYLAPDKIHIEEVFSKLIAEDKEKLWKAVELLDRYSIIDLKKGVANIHRLVQKVTELNLQKAVREEEVLRKALELINSGDIAISHIVSIWEYASKYGKLIDDFYFNSSCIHRKPFFIKKSTPLHLLAASGDFKAIKAILTHISTHFPGKLIMAVNVENNSGHAPLHFAVYNGRLDVVKYLVSKGADISAKSKDGSTLLHYAAQGGSLNVVEYLIDEKGTDINIKDNDGTTPLHSVAYLGYLAVVKKFIEKGADINSRDIYYKTPLHLAASNSDLDVVEHLVNKGANVNAMDKDGLTPLHCAVFRENLEIVEYLAEKGVNTKNKDDDTPLHFAAVMGKVAVAKILLKHNADVNAKNNEGKTALYYAANNNHQELVELLLAHGASYDY
ncbi:MULTISPECIES: ankyrin repeat domain-containing protein [unclassified Wolbachia]|uniref:ankyrin repeat domain-containing protein n=1 Tax=unclassified Wolbachia TaxID=2640676 RepID=UPI0021F81677|nr:MULTISPECIES: ankyrin repeat domain-containing protein [unclassified Wolbachia]